MISSLGGNVDLPCDDRISFCLIPTLPKPNLTPLPAVNFPPPIPEDGDIPSYYMCLFAYHNKPLERGIYLYLIGDNSEFSYQFCEYIDLYQQLGIIDFYAQYHKSCHQSISRLFDGCLSLMQIMEDFLNIQAKPRSPRRRCHGACLRLFLPSRRSNKK